MVGNLRPIGLGISSRVFTVHLCRGIGYTQIQHIRLLVYEDTRVERHVDILTEHGGRKKWGGRITTPSAKPASAGAEITYICAYVLAYAESSAFLGIRFCAAPRSLLYGGFEIQPHRPPNCPKLKLFRPLCLLTFLTHFQL